MNLRLEGPALLQVWRSWRWELLRGAFLFGVVVTLGLGAIHMVRAVASRWTGDLFDLAAFAGTRRVAGGSSGDALVWAGVLPRGERVYIRNMSGPITVEAVAGESLFVVVEKSWRRSDPDRAWVETRRHAGGMTFCALWEAREHVCGPDGEYAVRQPRRNDIVVRFLVRVPSGRAVDVSTVNGVVEVDGVESTVAAKTVNGKVRATIHHAPFSARTVNGAIEAVLGPLAAGAGGEIALSTVNGSITARLLPDASARIEAGTVNGRVETDLAVSGTVTARHVEGQVGSGGPRLRLRTVNGSVQVSRSVGDVELELLAPDHPVPPEPPQAPHQGIRRD